MSVYEQIYVSGGFELLFRVASKTSAFIARAVAPARIRAAMREAACPIRMQHSEGADCERMPHDGTNQAVAAIFAISQPVAVLYADLPPGDNPFPCADYIVDADIFTKDLASPTIMVASDPQNVDSCILEVGERGERTKAPAWNYRLPLEPEIEEVAVDDQGSCFATQATQERNERSLDLRARYTKVGVRDDVAGSAEHGSS